MALTTRKCFALQVTDDGARLYAVHDHSGVAPRTHHPDISNRIHDLRDVEGTTHGKLTRHGVCCRTVIYYHIIVAVNIRSVTLQ